MISRKATIVHLSFSRDRHRQAAAWLRARYPDCRFLEETAAGGIQAQVIRFLRQPPPYQQLVSPFLEHGTPFQQRVWQQIAGIPFGQRLSYGRIAESLGSRKLARAVGQACNANPLAVLIPCHRVVGRHGFGGFAGGAAIKRQLLEMEQAANGKTA